MSIGKTPTATLSKSVRQPDRDAFRQVRVLQKEIGGVPRTGYEVHLHGPTSGLDRRRYLLQETLFVCGSEKPWDSAGVNAMDRSIAEGSRRERNVSLRISLKSTGLCHFFAAVTGTDDADPVTVDSIMVPEIFVRGNDVSFGVPDHRIPLVLAGDEAAKIRALPMSSQIKSK